MPIHTSFGMDVSPPSGFSMDLREDTDLARSQITDAAASFAIPIDS
jgi:hypothetical protein